MFEILDPKIFNDIRPTIDKHSMENNIAVKEDRDNSEVVVVELNKHTLEVINIYKGTSNSTHTYMIFTHKFKNKCHICGGIFVFYDGCLVCEKCQRVHTIP